ncbi:MAG: serine--tRNA ligase [Oscillospiraceae bacterium]|nr:serine--tRNA ligase [Oscillospiraceae bacterium]
MLDIKLIRDNPDKVKQALLKRMDDVCFDDLLQWDSERRSLIASVEILKNERNTTSAEIPKLKKEGKNVDDKLARMKSVGEEIANADKRITELDELIFNFMVGLPNLPDDDVAAGGKENNTVLHFWGEKPIQNFQIKNHVDLCVDHGLIDYTRGAKLSGSGYWIYKGLGARLEWALINFFIREHLNNGYEFLLVPHILNYECGFTAGQFPKFMEDDYWIDGGPSQTGKFLLPTAETALVNYHRDEILSCTELPKKYFSYTPCFRREAGSARTLERGMIRGHQFNKVELFQYAHPDKSAEAFSEIVKNAETLVQKLGLHYRLSKLAAGDVSFAMARTCDIEVWIPSMVIYQEISSASNSNDFQARRGNIRFKDEEGKNRLVHTLNASGLATSRIIPALVEQNQQEDGSIIIPEVLRNDMGIEIIK